MTRSYEKEIDGVLVKITYDYYGGDKGDYDTPPAAPRAEVLYYDLMRWDEDKKQFDEEELEGILEELDEVVFSVETEDEILEDEIDRQAWLGWED